MTVSGSLIGSYDLRVTDVIMQPIISLTGIDRLDQQETHAQKIWILVNNSTYHII